MERNLLMYGIGISMMLLAVAFSGCLDTGDEVEHESYPLFDVEISSSTDEVTITIISGKVDWSEYNVMVDDVEFNTDSSSASAGITSIFTDPDGTFDFQVGTEYQVKIIDVEDNKIISSITITAT